MINTMKDNVMTGVRSSSYKYFSFYDLEFADRPGGDGKTVAICPPGDPFHAYVTLYFSNEQLRRFIDKLEEPNNEPCEHRSLEAVDDHFVCVVCRAVFEAKQREAENLESDAPEGEG